MKKINHKDTLKHLPEEEKPRYFSNTRMLTPSEIEAMRKDISRSIREAKGRFKDLA